MLRFALLASLAACWSRTAPPPASPTLEPAKSVATEPDIVGTHVQPTTVMMVCEGGDDGWCEETAEDVLEVRRGANGSLAIAVELVRTNGHTCTFEGQLQPAGANRWQYVTAADHEEGGCTLTLERDATSLALSADGCRHHCGVRASLDAAWPLRTR